jgi:AcrR family transcriptional regulator
LSRTALAAAAPADLRRSTLPRGPHALPAEEVARNQRERIFAALAEVVAEEGYQGASVARVVTRAGVSSRAFYAQFSSKRECFSLLHERCQERLFATLSVPCEPAEADLAELLRRSLGAGLELLAAEPAMARLLALEAPAAGGAIAERHHRWLGRYADLLAAAAAPLPAARRPSRSTELTIVGGIVSRVAQWVLAGWVDRLPELGPELAEVVLSFHGFGQGVGEGLA